VREIKDFIKREGVGMRCDTCRNRSGYTLGQDECGAGSFFEYCGKGHWEGGGPQSAEDERAQKQAPDFWVDCKDYSEGKEVWSLRPAWSLKNSHCKNKKGG